MKLFISVAATIFFLSFGLSVSTAQDASSNEAELMSVMPSANPPMSKDDSVFYPNRTCRCAGWECLHEPDLPPLCWCVNWVCYDFPIRKW